MNKMQVGEDKPPQTYFHTSAARRSRTPTSVVMTHLIAVACGTNLPTRRVYALYAGYFCQLGRSPRSVLTLHVVIHSVSAVEPTNSMLT
jgi:hypothetical protein